MKRSIAAVLVLACASAVAQDYPSRPVRMVVPFPPGGPLDVAGRLIGRELSERWGQPVVIDNKPGGTTGTEFLSKAAKDGYTLMIISSSPLVTLPQMQKVTYDVLKDFVGVAQTTALSYGLVAHPGSGITSIQQLIDEAKKTPGRLNYASGGVGSGQHLYVELLKLAAGIDLTQIPYKGAGPAMQALLAGEVHVMLDVVSAVIPAVKAGKARPLLIVSAKPALEQLPDTPNFDSLFPGAGILTWHGIFAPSGTPRPVLDKAAADIRQALQAPAVSNRFRELGLEPTGVSGDAFNEIVRRDYERWGEVIRKNKIRSD